MEESSVMMDEFEHPSNDHGEDHQLEVQQGDKRQEWWLEEENCRHSLQRAAIKKKYPNMTPNTPCTSHTFMYDNANMAEIRTCDASRTNQTVPQSDRESDKFKKSVRNAINSTKNRSTPSKDLWEYFDSQSEWLAFEQYLVPVTNDIDFQVRYLLDVPKLCKDIHKNPNSTKWMKYGADLLLKIHNGDMEPSSDVDDQDIEFHHELPKCLQGAIMAWENYRKLERIVHTLAHGALVVVLPEAFGIPLKNALSLMVSTTTRDDLENMEKDEIGLIFHALDVSNIDAAKAWYEEKAHPLGGGVVPDDATWQLRLDDWLALKTAHGEDFEIPHCYKVVCPVSAKIIDLGRWVREQHYKFKKLMQNPGASSYVLTISRMLELEQNGFNFLGQRATDQQQADFAQQRQRLEEQQLFNLFVINSTRSIEPITDLIGNNVDGAAISASLTGGLEPLVDYSKHPLSDIGDDNKTKKVSETLKDATMPFKRIFNCNPFQTHSDDLLLPVTGTAKPDQEKAPPPAVLPSMQCLQEQDAEERVKQDQARKTIQKLEQKLGVCQVDWNSVAPVQKKFINSVEAVAQMRGEEMTDDQCHEIYQTLDKTLTTYPQIGSSFSYDEGLQNQLSERQLLKEKILQQQQELQQQQQQEQQERRRRQQEQQERRRRRQQEQQERRRQQQEQQERRRQQEQPERRRQQEDDLKLWDAYQKLGPQWSNISYVYFKNSRSNHQLRYRWNSEPFKEFISSKFGPEAHRDIERKFVHLEEQKKKKSFTEEEDYQLWNAYNKAGSEWKLISKEYFNNSRSYKQLKRRWISEPFKDFVSSQFGPEAYSIAEKNCIVKMMAAIPQAQSTLTPAAVANEETRSSETAAQDVQSRPQKKMRV